VGDGSQKNQATPRKVPVEKSKKVGTFNFASCAISESDNIFCWGLNNGIFLENSGSTDFFLKPVLLKTKVKIDSLAGSQTFVGNDKEDKKTFHIWGDNEKGQAAVGSTQHLFIEPQVVQFSKNVKKFDAESFNTCFLYEDGILACSGENEFCQMISDDKGNRLSPVPLNDLPPLSDFSMAGRSICGITMEGDVYCWGDNSAQVDGGKEKVLCKPTKVEGLPKAAQLANGGQSSCILSVDNEVYCWGFYWNGTLTGDKIGFTPPKKVPWLASLLRPDEATLNAAGVISST
jgi:alpha-tubulin suppressor-like RCC1 family protein